MGLNLKKLGLGALRIAAPIIGGIVGGPAGAAIGGAAAGAIGSGKPKLSNIAGGAVGGALGAGAIPGAGGAIGKAAGGLSKLGVGTGDLIDLGLAGFSAYQGNKADKRAQKADQQALAMQQQALKFANEQYAERAPFRKLGTSMALDQQPEDVSALFASSNPFARRRRIA